MQYLWAKSDGETLLEHSSLVLEIARIISRSLPFSDEVLGQISFAMSRVAAVHDIGKGATGFQNALHTAGGKGKWGFRHEILSAAYSAQWFPQLSAPEIFAILTHHRNIPGETFLDRGERGLPEDELPYEDRAEWRQMCVQFEENRAAVEEIIHWASIETSLAATITWKSPTGFGGLDEVWLRRDFQRGRVSVGERRFASLLRGLLITSDHMASAHIDPNKWPAMPMLRRYERRILRYESRGEPPLPFQSKCGETLGNVILKAPTGSGKTLAIFLWACNNQSRNGRLFYALPHTASLNAMHQRLRRIFGVKNCGILHHRNAAYLFRLLQGDSISLDVKGKVKKAKLASVMAKLAREMYFPIRATTPHQILRGALKGQGWELSLAEFPNACFVFDEIHAFEPKLFGLTVAMAKWLQGMGAKLLFASATLPQFAENILCEQLNIPDGSICAPDPDNRFDAVVLGKKRHRVRVVAGTMSDYVPLIIEELQVSNESALLVCNHVNTSQAIFTSMLQAFPRQVALLHSRFNGRDRNQIEKAITSKAPPRILVATQAVEVSLDLDYNRGYIEPAPADALGQRLGRINRKGSAALPVPVVIFEESVGGDLYDKILTSETVKHLKLLGNEGVLSEADLTRIVSIVYEGGYPPDSQASFEQGLNNLSLKNFDEDILAGTHYAWLEELLEKADGQVESFPPLIGTDEEGKDFDMQGIYSLLLRQGRYLEAKQLLVPIRIGQFFGLKTMDAVIFNKQLGEWTTTQRYTSRTGLDLSRQIDTII